MATYFPQAQNVKLTHHYIKLKERTGHVLDKLLGKQTQSLIDEVDAYFLKATSPKQFYGPDGIEAQSIKRFEDLCIHLSQHVPKDPRTMSVLEFFRTLEVIKEKTEKQGKRR